ncbi:MAG: TniQ family protein [Solirubrobacteraceae bacterium]
MSAPAVAARIPIRFEPVAGESFDGWLEAYAQRLLMSAIELGHALGVSPKLLRLQGANVAKGDSGLDAEQIAARACGADPDAVRALWFGLARYDRLIAERVARADAPRCAVGWFGRVLRPMVSSRWCPSCLAQSGGRWLAAWRLPWYLACPTHQTMLASGCPACGATQRHAGLRAGYVPALLTSCSRPTAGQAGRRDHRCRQDLARIATPSAPDELIALQAEMVAILDPAVSETAALGLVDGLVDLLIIATRAGLDLRVIDRDRRNMQRILSGPLVEAHRALSDPRGARMRAIATSDPARVPGALPQAFDGVSPALAAILINHRDHRLGATERLRYRSMTAAARRPEGVDLAMRLRALPLALWPDWSIRLRPATIPPYTFRVAAAIALCVPGSTHPTRIIREHWPGAQDRKQLVTLGQLITDDPHGTAILAALCALADSLDRGGAPIDYERRRRLASATELLDSHAWRVMCRAAGTPAGAQPKLAHARLWLWETLTGGLPRQAPSPLGLGCPELLSRHSRFTFGPLAATVRRLAEHARRFLDIHGCHHEPLTWSPITDDIELDRLPGPDPDAIDPGSVHAAISTPPTPRRAAAKLGITVEHLHYIARKHPSELHDPSDPTTPDRVRFAALLSADQLRELIAQGNSLRQIEASCGISRRTIHDELVAHGIPIPPRDKLRRAIERDWLEEQYVTKRRTTVAIAGELGVSRSTISKLLHQHGIPVRLPGSGSHQQNLTAGDGFPDPLASAVHGRGGADRVRCFQVYGRARSLTAGAKRLAVGQYALTLQLAKLERACQAPLLERLTRDQRLQRPQRPTTLGQTLLDQADQYLGPNPKAPQQLPEPLATVLGAHFGEKKLATFLAATAWPTIGVAALELGIQPGSLQRAIRNLDRVLGERVLTDRGTSAPLQLTPIGSSLLTQARQHEP